MKGYDDIINIPHWEPKNHKRMELSNRASQFAPFAALVGHDEAIRETARITDAAQEVDSISAQELNEKINLLIDNVHLQPEIEVSYFVPDLKKSGGAYVRHHGCVRRIDDVEQLMIFTDGVEIPLAMINGLHGTLFAEIENRD